MLQFPTNVYPQNIAVDITRDYLMSFEFNGDILSNIFIKEYDYSSGDLIRSRWEAGSESRLPIGYNGDVVSINLDGNNPHLLTNGNDYYAQMMLVQMSTDGLECIYDMPIVRGQIESASRTNVTIADNIMNIYEWNVQGDSCFPTYVGGTLNAGAILKVGNESHFINSYNRRTGQIVLDNAFSSNISGKEYTILCNYLVTPQYYFMCRALPTLSVQASLRTYEYGQYAYYIPPSIVVEGSYNQIDGTMIKYYNVSLYYTDNPNVSYTRQNLLRTSPNIYSQQIKYEFYNPWVMQEDETLYYTIVCNVVTQDGESRVIATDTFSLSPENELVIYENLELKCVNNYTPDYIEGQRYLHQAVKMSFDENENLDVNNKLIHYPIDIYRTDLETGKSVHLFGHARSIGTRKDGIADWTVPNRGFFEYTIVPRDIETGVPYITSIISGQIKTSFMGYSITELKKSTTSDDTSYQIYQRGDSWEFCGEIDDTTTTQNLNISSQVGHNRYPTAMRGESNYLSGTFTADIGYMSCPDGEYKDTIDMINAWREFISRDSMYLLKTQKGDVLIVNIVGTPTVMCEEGIPNIPSRISFDWEECENLDNVLLFLNLRNNEV